MASVARSEKILELSRADDPKQWLIDSFDISNFETLTGENLLVGAYIWPEKIGSIIKPEGAVGEDEFQGNIGLVLKVGDGFSEEEQKDMLHKWVMFGYNDGKKYRQDGIPFRIMKIGSILAVVKYPSRIT